LTNVEPTPPDQVETVYVPKYIKSPEATEPSLYVPEYINGKAKQIRHTKVVINGIRDEIIAILEESHPQTVRQVFYALTVRGKILKVEEEYHRTVVRLLVDLRGLRCQRVLSAIQSNGTLRSSSLLTCKSCGRRRGYLSPHTSIWLESLAGKFAAPQIIPLRWRGG
jgi:hypothetical protein